MKVVIRRIRQAKVEWADLKLKLQRDLAAWRGYGGNQ